MDQDTGSKISGSKITGSRVTEEETCLCSNVKESLVGAEGAIHLVPTNRVGGYDVWLGFYDTYGATAIPGGVNFTIHSRAATGVGLLLFRRTEDESYTVLPSPKHYRVGNAYSMTVFKLDTEEFEYTYRVTGPWGPEKGPISNPSKYLLDSYVKAVTGQSLRGQPSTLGWRYKVRTVKDDFDWGDNPQPLIPMQDLIVYELHVRGYIKHGSSGVKFPGTFEGPKEEVPYLMELGVNAAELMSIFEFDEMLDYRETNGEKLYNHWGYNTASFFSPNTSYTASKEYNREGNELRRLIHLLNTHGTEVYLDVVSNHTAEGNENGPYFSFKGLDNSVYYMLTPEGFYYNFSGRGNTLNCNHSIVQQLIVSCLRYWITAYRVDGLRFDPASTLGRNGDGSPMDKPPLLQQLAFGPILGNVKLIAEAWDAGGLYQVGDFPFWSRWAEWNGRYRDDMRRYLRGDEGMARVAVLRIAGSGDVYEPSAWESTSVNFITCHNGFTLYDLYPYNEKHNENNGWGNTDGSNDNYSWNCGTEGEIRNEAVNALRRRMIRNVRVVLIRNRGILMFLVGDEFGNTQFGNNNSYCHDGEVSWLDWGLLDKNWDVFQFFQFMIHLRKEHPVLWPNVSDGFGGFPDISFHGTGSWIKEFSSYDRYIGVMMAGQIEGRVPKAVYIANNAYWEQLDMVLPEPPESMAWSLEVSTWENDGREGKPVESSSVIPPRTVMILCGKIQEELRIKLDEGRIDG